MKKQDGLNYDYPAWNDYMAMMAELDVMADDCPANFNCTVNTIGQSVEGRDIRVLEISTGQNTGKSFWVDSLIHAREWLAGGTTMNLFNRLIRGLALMLKPLK